MKTHTVDIPELLDSFIQEQVNSGDHANAESVIVASLLRAKAEADEQAVKMERFLAKIQVGIDQLDRGEGIEVTDVVAYLNQLRRDVDARFHADRADKAA